MNLQSLTSDVWLDPALDVMAPAKEKKGRLSIKKERPQALLRQVNARGHACIHCIAHLGSLMLRRVSAHVPKNLAILHNSLIAVFAASPCLGSRLIPEICVAACAEKRTLQAFRDLRDQLQPASVLHCSLGNVPILHGKYMHKRQATASLQIAVAGNPFVARRSQSRSSALLQHITPQDLMIWRRPRFGWPTSVAVTCSAGRTKYHHQHVRAILALAQ
jgi:hypothetical protein